MKLPPCSKWLLPAVLVLPLVLAGGARAAEGNGKFWESAAQPNHFAKPAGGMSLEQAADKVRRETGGRVLSATPTERGGRNGYDIRVLLDGKRVKRVFVDAGSDPR